MEEFQPIDLTAPEDEMKVIAHQHKSENVDVNLPGDDSNEIDGHLPLFVILKNEFCFQRFSV